MPKLVVQKTPLTNISNKSPFVNRKGNQYRFVFAKKKESTSNSNKKTTKFVDNNNKTKQDFYKNINLLSNTQTNIFNMKQSFSRTSSLSRKKISQHSNATKEKIEAIMEETHRKMSKSDIYKIYVQGEVTSYNDANNNNGGCYGSDTQKL